MASNVCAASFISELLYGKIVVTRSGSKHFRRVTHCRDFIENGQSVLPPPPLANLFEKNLLTNTRQATKLRHFPSFGLARLQIETNRKRDSGLVLALFTIGDPEGNVHARASEHFYPFLNSSSRSEFCRNRDLTTHCA